MAFSPTESWGTPVESREDPEAGSSDPHVPTANESGLGEWKIERTFVPSFDDFADADLGLKRLASIPGAVELK